MRRVPAAWRGRSVYVEVGVTGPIAASAQSFIGETLTALGLVNVIGAEQGLFPKVNPEMVVRRNPDAKWLRREADIFSFAKTQARILDALWQVVRPGGKLLYVTCSVFPAGTSGTR